MLWFGRLVHLHGRLGGPVLQLEPALVWSRDFLRRQRVQTMPCWLLLPWERFVKPYAVPHRLLLESNRSGGKMPRL